MSRRRRARAIVLQVLYQDDLNPTQPTKIKTQFVNARLNEDPKLIAFANELIQGVTQYREQIDEKLASIAANWRLGRRNARSSGHQRSDRIGASLRDRPIFPIR